MNLCLPPAPIPTSCARNRASPTARSTTGDAHTNKALLAALQLSQRGRLHRCGRSFGLRICITARTGTSLQPKRVSSLRRIEIAAAPVAERMAQPSVRSGDLRLTCVVVRVPMKKSARRLQCLFCPASDHNVARDQRDTLECRGLMMDRLRFFGCCVSELDVL